MIIVSWYEWLDKHIPYYESTKHSKAYALNPPLDVLIIHPSQRQYISFAKSNQRFDWELCNEKITALAKGRIEPLFLERDTKQEWYWAFWKKGDALFVNLSI